IRRRRRRLRPRASPSPLPTSPPPSAAAPASLRRRARFPFPARSPTPPRLPPARRRRFPARSPPRRARLPPRASPSPLPTSPPPSAAAPASLRPLTDAAPSPSTAAPRPPPYTRLAVAAPHRARLPPPPRPSLASASPTRCPSHSSSPRPASAPGAAAAAALSGAPASPPRRRHHRQHYPGLVQLPEGLEVADTFDHYAAVNDVEDREGRKFNNLMDRVINEMLDFYRIEEGYEALARQVARTACHKLVKDMMYEARNQAIIDLNTAMDVQVKRKEAVKIFPTKEQYLAPMPGSAGSNAGAGVAPVQDVDLSAAVRNLFPSAPPPFDP
ncbi:hypothetical protein EJB05_38058, partial [Eragrostis curvula]